MCEINFKIDWLFFFFTFLHCEKFHNNRIQFWSVEIQNFIVNHESQRVRSNIDPILKQKEYRIEVEIFILHQLVDFNPSHLSFCTSTQVLSLRHVLYEDRRPWDRGFFAYQLQQKNFVPQKSWPQPFEVVCRLVVSICIKNRTLILFWYIFTYFI